MGGVLAAIDNGYIQREIADASYRYQQEIDAGRRTIVGVNGYTTDEPVTIPILRMDPEGERRQVQRLEALRRERDNREAVRCLADLEHACRNNTNVMPPLVAAVEALCTLQEMCDVMRDVFGAYQEVAVV
jgi:methylmalonyl-CoA mutase N-terminal domain/subunit